MSAVVNYPLAAFPNGRVNTASLAQEILAADLSPAVLRQVIWDGSECGVYFEEEPDPAEVKKLDVVVAAHTGDPPPQRGTPTASLTTDERLKSQPTAGVFVFDSTLGRMFYYNGADWVVVT